MKKLSADKQICKLAAELYCASYGYPELSAFDAIKTDHHKRRWHKVAFYVLTNFTPSPKQVRGK